MVSRFEATSPNYELTIWTMVNLYIYSTLLNIIHLIVLLLSLIIIIICTNRFSAKRDTVLKYRWLAVFRKLFVSVETSLENIECLSNS